MLIKSPDNQEVSMLFYENQHVRRSHGLYTEPGFLQHYPRPNTSFAIVVQTYVT